MRVTLDAVQPGDRVYVAYLPPSVREEAAELGFSESDSFVCSGKDGSRVELTPEEGPSLVVEADVAREIEVERLRPELAATETGDSSFLEEMW